MGKQSGIGANFYVSGFDVSGDTNELTSVRGGPKLWDTTDITQQARSRLGLLKEGELMWKSFFDPSTTGEHAALSGLSYNDYMGSFLVPPLGIGAPVASLVGKLSTAEYKRPNSGELSVDYHIESNAFGLEWGNQLTVGKRTDTAATNGLGNNDGAGTALGLQAYLHAFSFTGTDVTVTVQTAPDNVTYTNLISFSQITGGTPSFQRVQTASNATVQQYVRVITTTSGGFSNLVFFVHYSRNLVAVAF